MSAPQTPHERTTTNSHKRSRSPHDDENTEQTPKRHRSRSPYRRTHHHRREHTSSKAAQLPLNARHLNKHDIDTYRALFCEYLDIQKRIDISELSADEVKGRWKSFLGKWNRGELAEGWYEEGARGRADERAREADASVQPWREAAPSVARDDGIARAQVTREQVRDGEGEEEDDGYGPALPDSSVVRKRIGPAIPNLQDLQDRREQASEDRGTDTLTLRHERKLDRLAQKAHLEELVPRAEPGSRERHGTRGGRWT